jgi:hypothetical protein
MQADQQRDVLYYAQAEELCAQKRSKVFLRYPNKLVWKHSASSCGMSQ